MKIEDNLKKIRYLIKKIEMIKADIEYFKSQCDIGSPFLNPNKVQTSRNTDGFQNSACLLADKQEELDALIIKLNEKQKENAEFIDVIENPKIYEIMYLYYVHARSINEIAKIVNRESSGVYKLKKYGKKIIQNIQ